jgi:hypothetical protein
MLFLPSHQTARRESTAAEYFHYLQRTTFLLCVTISVRDFLSNNTVIFQPFEYSSY